MKAKEKTRDHKNKQNGDHNFMNIVRAAWIYGAVMAIVIYLLFSSLSDI